MEERPPGSAQPPQTPPPQAPPPPQGPPPYEAPPSGQSPNRTIMLVLSYLGILALIPLLVEKEDAEVQWHAKHGIILLAAWIVVWIALIIISMVPVVGTVIGCLLSVVLPLGILVVHIICIVKALNGDKFRLPFLSDFADQWK
jgi:uncharacterized membrane protein